MALDSRLEIRLLQKLILTPQLQQAIKLLQMPQLELSQSLTQELMENPFLEEAEEPLTEAIEALQQEAAQQEEELPDDTEVPLEKLMSFGVDDYFEERGLDGRDLGYFNPGTVAPPSFENYTSKGMDLQEHLLWQLRLGRSPQRLRRIAEVVIGNIDDNGYLRTSVEELSAMAECCPKEVKEAVSLVQSFETTCVRARSLKECLLLQLEALGLRNTLVETLVMYHLEDLQKKRYQQLVKRFGIKLEELLSAVKVIESLEPKPGRNYTSSSPAYIVPDVYVIRAGDELHIMLNDEGLPRLRLNSYYKKLLTQKNSLDKEEKRSLEDKLRAAIWLMKSLEQRNRTICRVTESIVKFQREFFDKGTNYLKPLNLRDVAQELGMHESTISRATANKYLACCHGLFSFRFFFSSAVNDGQVSSTSVKELIKKIVSEEDPRKPLSDQQIVRICQARGIKIARRTVAKYRQELNIASQSQRKRYEL